MEGLESLLSLREMIRVEREGLKEKLANPIKDPMERERVAGQCIAHAWTIDKISQQIKSLRGDNDDATATQKPTRPTYK